MSWRNDYNRIPDALRREVLARDKGHCTMRLPNVCAHRATEVDHEIPDYQGGRTELPNLRAVCSPCHAVKTRTEREQALAYRAARRRLPRDTHPSQVLPPR